MLNFCDYLAIGLAILMYVVPMNVDQSGFLTSFLMRTFLAILAIAVMILPCGWVRRYKSQKERQRLLSLPIHTASGKITTAYPTFTEHHGSVPSGYSVGPDGDYFVHYTYGRTSTPTGQYHADVLLNNGWLSLKSLPKPFSDKPSKILPTSHSVTISYVTDADGTNYFISASQN